MTRTVRATFAVILARGLGSRLRAEGSAAGATDAAASGAPALSEAQLDAAARGAKGLMPVHGRPLLDYVLDELAEGGVRDVVFVVAPDDVALRRYYDDESPTRRIRVRYAIQVLPRGTADALLAAREAVLAPAGAPHSAAGVRHFLVCNADNLYPAASVSALVSLGAPGLVAFDAAGLTADGSLDDERVRRFALVDLAADDSLREIVEKPSVSHPLAKAPTRWVSMNLWRFTDEIFAHCAAVTPSPRGELELVDAVRASLAAGATYRAVRQRERVLDLSFRGDVARLEAALSGRTPRP